jgi:hypothetical protein
MNTLVRGIALGMARAGLQDDQARLTSALEQLEATLPTRDTEAHVGRCGRVLQRAPHGRSR